MAAQATGTAADLTDVAGAQVLLAGGASGLGLGMVRPLVAAGPSVVFTGRDAGRVAEREATAAPGTATGIGMDAREEASVAEGVAAARATLGSIDIMVNNAGSACGRSTRAS